MRKKDKRRRRVLLPLLLIVLAVLFIQSDWIGRWIYPISYKEEIKLGAAKYDLDPLLIAAIIRVESNYKPTAESHKGALGIMQIMPNTAEWIVQQADLGRISAKQAGTDVNAGITMGAWYVKELHRLFDGSLPKALAAYNAGPGKVRQWLDEGRWDGTEAKLGDIPYGETRHYVQRVLYYYKKYTNLYETL
ncbi:lytic transglycosylase domain-containing protein [Cohnella sp. GCM10027633]|uniref:lytic transglycosylase domain-containing protein n=1 Tax=unclassified Cohnella TaxID=2636738 RepID=UPI0036440E47